MGNIRTQGGERMVINTVSQAATLDELLVYIFEHIDGWTTRDVIWDLSGCDFAGITATKLRELIAKTERVTEKRKGLRTAIVAQSDVAFGLMRMFSMLAEGRYQLQVEAFRALDEAQAWLLATDHPTCTHSAAPLCSSQCSPGPHGSQSSAT